MADYIRTVSNAKVFLIMSSLFNETALAFVHKENELRFI